MPPMFQEHFAEERNVTEEELKDLYAAYVQEHYVDAYTDGSYALNESYVAQGYTDIPYLYIPENFIFVRVIQLSDKVKATDTLNKIQGGEDFATTTRTPTARPWATSPRPSARTTAPSTPRSMRKPALRLSMT